MTDNEIIKALKSDIRLADYIDSDYCGAVDKALIQSAINSINRLQAKVIKEQNKNSKLRNERNHLQAEIERLKECPKCVYEYDAEIMEYCVQGPCPNFQTVEQIKAEAYKEFADLSIKRICEQVSAPTPSKSYIVERCNQEIYNLLKETVGEE